MIAALRILWCLSVFVTGCWCLPVEEISVDGKFIGKATSELATALLQGYADKEENLAYSPFGFSVLLAVFSEGARGPTRDEIASAFHFPKDVNLVRKAYKNVLERFAEKNLDSPEFKNWFYIFKNYSVNENVQEILRKYYLTEVKHVEKPMNTFSDSEKPQTDEIVNENEEPDKPEKSPFNEKFSEKKDQSKTDEKPFEEVGGKDSEKLEKVADENSKKSTQNDVQTISDKVEKVEETQAMPSPLNKMKKPVEVENFLKDKENNLNEIKSVAVETKDSAPEASEDTKKDLKPFKKTLSKEPTKIADSKDVNEGLDETTILKIKTKTEIKDEITVTSKAEIQDDKGEVTAKNEEAVHTKGSTNSEDEENLVEILKAKNMKKLKDSKEKDSAKVKEAQGVLPIEHLSGMTDSAIKIKGKEESHPRMIVFNGMYYKGEWQGPFEKRPPGLSRAFYKSNKEKIYVPTIHSEGYYNASSIEDLGCQAIDIPYKGGRYSLLILVPNERDGLNKLISHLSEYPLSKIHDQLSEKLVEVCLPTFEINTISKPVSSLKKNIINVKRIFDPDLADLSEISTADSGLFVDELVQMITFKVDSEYTKANYLTASIGYSRSDVPSFQANQPFLFFLRDKSEDLTLVNGKVVDPTPKPAFYFS